MNGTMPHELTNAALQMAITNRCPASSLMHHFGRRSQYSTYTYRQLPASKVFVDSTRTEKDVCQPFKTSSSYSGRASLLRQVSCCNRSILPIGRIAVRKSTAKQSNQIRHTFYPSCTREFRQGYRSIHT